MTKTGISTLHIKPANVISVKMSLTHPSVSFWSQNGDFMSGQLGNFGDIFFPMETLSNTAYILP